MGDIGGLVAVVVLVAANSFFVAVEFGLVAVDRTKVDLAVEAGDRRAGVLAGLLRRLSFHLSGVQLGITVCSVVLGVLAAPVVASLLEPALRHVVGDRVVRSVSVGVALALATVAQMVIGELIPKAIAVAKPLETARALAPAQRAFAFVAGPLIRLFDGAATGVVRLLGIEPSEDLSSVRSRSELARLVASSGRSGTMGRAEAQLVSRAFRFTEKSVGEVLTPRPDVIALPDAATGAELSELSLATGHSRFPVYDGDLDSVVGVVHVKSLFDVEPDVRESVPVSDLMVAPMVVPESRDLDTLLPDMRQRGAYLVVVADEYGGTAGIVTVEDLIEELVGEIDDEHDVATQQVSRRGGGEVVLSGGFHADEVRDASGFEMPEGGYDTLAGFVLDRLGRIPVVGDEMDEAGWVIRVEEMDRRRIAKVSLRAPADRDDPRGS